MRLLTTLAAGTLQAQSGAMVLFPSNSPQFVYWGGFAVCSDWCGPYAAGR